MNISQVQITRTKSVRNNYFSRRDVRNAVLNQYHAIALEHPQWTFSLFDEYFVNTKIIPAVLEALRLGDPVNPNELANQWADQIHLRPSSRREMVGSLTQIIDQMLSEVL